MSAYRAATGPAGADEPPKNTGGIGSGRLASWAPRTWMCSPSKVTGVGRFPQFPHHVQEFAGACVALLLVQEVAVGLLLVRFTAGHHIQQQPAARNAAGKVAPICAARVGLIRPGRNATRNFRVSVVSTSMAVVSQASSHQVPVGVRTASKPCPQRPGR